MNAVGQGGGRGSTLLYSLRSLPERLQAAAPGCCHFALATWIHRQTDPWLTLQVELSKHSLQYCTVFSCLLRSVKSAQLSSNQTCARVWHCLLQSEIKIITHQNVCFALSPSLLVVGQFFLSYFPTATTHSSVYLPCVSNYANKVNIKNSARD